MSFTTVDIIAYIIALVGILAVVAWIFSWIFRPGKQIKLLSLQTNLLIKMAEKAGVSKDEIEGIVNSAHL